MLQPKVGLVVELIVIEEEFTHTCSRKVFPGTILEVTSRLAILVEDAESFREGTIGLVLVGIDIEHLGSHADALAVVGLTSRV